MSVPAVAPTVVLVHGAFADASSWSGVHAALKADGVTVLAPPNPLRGLAYDAAYLASFVAQIDGPVVLVGHSYGGAVITVAGTADNVVGLVYVAAYALEEGESLGELQGRFPDSKLAANLSFAPYPIPGADDGTDVSIARDAFPAVFAADVPAATTEFLANAQRPLAAAAFEEPAAAAAWKTTPAWGLVAAADQAINPDVERFGYERAGMTTIEVEGASHAVALSQPDVVAGLIRRALAAGAPAVVLEPAARAFADATAKPPFLFDLGPVEGRKVVDETQAGEIAKPAVDEEWITVAGGPTGEVRVRIVKPQGATGTLPTVLYVHGAGWVFGNAHTHDRLVRELAVGTGAAIVFPEYDLSPEARYPVAIEQSYAAARWIVADGASLGLDATRLAVAGDSVGGNMAAALTLMAKERGDVSFRAQALFYPVTDASFDTASYHQFAEGYWLRRDAMTWFWDQYTTDPAERAQITASPLRATADDLAGLPKALVINAEADVLRDEGEAYARHLRAAGVDVTATRYGGAIHDFMMVNALRETNAADAAIAQAVAFLTSALEG